MLMSGELSERRKKLIYRSAYTGTKETDLLLGGFARRHMATLTEAQLESYETLLEIEDPRLYKWISGMEEAPLEYQTDVLDLILDFKLVG
jgi:antitoxin CptB